MDDGQRGSGEGESSQDGVFKSLVAEMADLAESGKSIVAKQAFD